MCQCILLTESSRPSACSAFVWLPKTKTGVHFYGFLKNSPISKFGAWQLNYSSSTPVSSTCSFVYSVVLLMFDQSLVYEPQLSFLS